jgi:3-hydroxyisobutyrate dehydrogenase-like beta-hydroxyacid dehydrogenase
MEQGGGELPVGFVGLGQMGRALVARLRDVGVPSIVFNRTRTNVESLLSEKIQWAESPAEVGRRAASGIVFLMPSDAKALKSLTFGRRGLARGARQDSLVVNLSTITPDDARSIATRFGERHIRYLDCPVGGSVEAARNGQLSLFVGGEEADAARARPFLEKIGASISLVGPVGAGSSMKLVNNVLTIGQVALISEAIALGETLGLDREQVRGSSPIVELDRKCSRISGPPG